MSITVEIAVDTLNDAVAAERGGAQRIELCSDLGADGLSPSMDLVQKVRSAVSIPIHVMVRPRPGDFCYSDQEFQQMRTEIQHLKDLGVEGIVLGILTHNRSVDIERTSELIALASPLSVTFHRAFDAAAAPLAAFEDIIRTGALRLLTSGQKKSAVEGLSLIQQLHKRSFGRIFIMPGAGIDRTNASMIVDSLAVREIHIGKGVKTLNSQGMYEVDERKMRELIASIN
jgi:copper homeostasis protein